MGPACYAKHRLLATTCLPKAIFIKKTHAACAAFMRAAFSQISRCCVQLWMPRRCPLWRVRSSRPWAWFRLEVLPTSTFCHHRVQAAAGLDAVLLDLMFDAQTSGGMILAIDSRRVLVSNLAGGAGRDGGGRWRGTTRACRRLQSCAMLTIHLVLASGAVREVSIRRGQSYLHVLFERGLTTGKAICAGVGLCGQCRVRFVENPPPPLPEEAMRLGASAVGDGWARLPASGRRAELP